MDPNANLDQQLDIAKRIQQLADSDAPLESFAEKLDALAEELADRVQALDDWITGGGFLPERWARNDEAMKTWTELDGREKHGPDIPGRNEWRRCANALAAERGSSHGR